MAAGREIIEMQLLCFPRLAAAVLFFYFILFLFFLFFQQQQQQRWNEIATVGLTDGPHVVGGTWVANLADKLGWKDMHVQAQQGR